MGPEPRFSSAPQSHDHCLRWRLESYAPPEFKVRDTVSSTSQRALLVLWWFCGRTFQPQLTHTKSTIRERTRYQLCRKYLRKVAIWNQGDPHNNGRNNAGLNQTATKTTDQTHSLIVPLSTSWLVSSHSPSTYHARSWDVNKTKFQNSSSRNITEAQFLAFS